MKSNYKFYLAPVIIVLTMAILIYKYYYGTNTIFKDVPTISDIENNSKSDAEEESFDNRRLRMDEEVEMLKNPFTNKIPPGIKEKELNITKNIPAKEDLSQTDNLNNYEFLGPYNIGGRTRALAYDKNNSNIILAGGVGSGIYRSTVRGVLWKNVTPNGEFHNVSCIGQDPVVREIWKLS